MLTNMCKAREVFRRKNTIFKPVTDITFENRISTSHSYVPLPK